MFTIAPGGLLRPPSIGAPASFPVQVTMTSGDQRAHRVVLRTPTPHTLSVPAGGHASILLTGLAKGSYAVEVDGATRGALTIGVQPGP